MKKIMSNRIVSLLLALLFIAPLMFLATACGKTVATVSTYVELVEALNGDKQVVKLAQDIDVEDTLVVDRKVTLDMNGKKLSNSKDILTIENYTIYISYNNLSVPTQIADKRG